MKFDQVRLISHADWSKDPGKRWMATAVLQANHRWSVCDLEQIIQPSKLLSNLKSRLPEPGCILSGFDFPIGIPLGYAEKAGLTDFIAALQCFGRSGWERFYFPAENPTEISITRPFYPQKPGGSKRIHPEHGLGVPFVDLYRLCEKGYDNRRPACPLFWTMGGQQVGKAAISGWCDLLLPALADLQLNLKLWPFSGSLTQLCLPGNIAVVETYPAEFYTHLGLSFSTPFRRSKRRQLDRLAFTGQLITWARSHCLDLDESIIVSIQDGFGTDPSGEDRFDALVGLYGMINVILGQHTCWEPDLPYISKIEGWIYGQERPKGVISDSFSAS